MVFLHEISHGLAAALSGGRIVAIGLTFDEGGVCITDGGSRFLILNAGYLGSLFWGALFLVLSARTRASREITGFVGVFVLAVTLLYVRSLFGFLYGLLAGAALVLCAAKLPRDILDDLLQTIGVVSCLYALWDIGSDVVTREVPGSDASALGLITGIPGVVWGVALDRALPGRGVLRAAARGSRPVKARPAPASPSIAAMTGAHGRDRAPRETRTMCAAKTPVRWGAPGRERK